MDNHNEKSYIRQMIKLLDTNSVVAIVGDAYNIYNFCNLIGEMKGEIQQYFDQGKTVVIRPDSGDPLEVLPKMMLILEKYYGAPKNTKGYKVLNNVRVLWGDGINLNSIESILRTMVDLYGYSADNFAFGMGGALLGAPQRDDLGWAMKCSSISINEMVENTEENFPTNGLAEIQTSGYREKLVQRDVFKDPVTAKSKTSKKGRVTLFRSGDSYVTDIERDIPKHWTDKGTDWKDCLETYFENGEVKFTQTFEQVRANSKV